MRHVEHRGQLVPELVGRKILDPAQPGEIVVGEAPRPHELAHRVVIVRVPDRRAALFDRHPQHRLGDLVGQLVAQDRAEIPVEGVHHDIHHAARHLIDGQRNRELRVHHRKAGPHQIAAEPALLPRLLVGQHRRAARFAARRRNRQYDPHRRAARGGRLPRPELPDVHAGISQPQRDRLGRVDDASAAHREQEIRPKRPRPFERPARKGKPRIGPDPAERLMGELRRIQAVRHPADQPAFDRAAAPVEHQHPAAALPFYEGAHLRLRLFPEHHARRGVVRKALHCQTSSVRYPISVIVAA